MWDNTWIYNVCLKEERKKKRESTSYLQTWKPDNLDEYCKAAKKYADYFCLMLSEIDKTSRNKYSKIKQAYIKYTKISEDVFEWYFYDIGPIIFEVCLLGKNHKNIKKEEKKKKK
jgi:hypothetical protein